MVHGFCLNLHVLESVLCLPVPALGAVSAWSSMGGRRPGVERLLWLLFFIVRDVFQDPEIKLFSFLQQLSFFHRKGLMWMAIFALFTFGEKGEKERGSVGICLSRPRGPFRSCAPIAHQRHSAGKPCRPGRCPPGWLFCRPPRGPQPDGGPEAASARGPRWVHMARRNASKEKREANGSADRCGHFKLPPHCLLIDRLNLKSGQITEDEKGGLGGGCNMGCRGASERGDPLSGNLDMLKR